MACKLTANKHKYLAFRLHWRGLRWWEGTGVRDTRANRSELEKKAQLISAEIRTGTFDAHRYLEHFPDGNKVREFRAALAEAPPTAVPQLYVPTLNDFFATWIARQQPPYVRPQQSIDYSRHITGYVLGAPVGGDDRRTLGELPLTELRLSHLKELRQRLADDGLSIKYARNIMGASFRAMIRDAREELDGLALTDPFSLLRWPRAEVRPPDPYTRDEREKILGYFAERHPFYYPWVYTRFWTGMRPSEAAALRLSDFDAVAEKIQIRVSRHRGVDGETKTRGSKRTIDLTPEVTAVLRDLVPLKVDPARFLFTNRYTGGAINQGEWAREYWGRCLRALGLRPRRFYDTRHTFISEALTRGANIKWLAEYCGTSVVMIEKHYGRFMETQSRSQLELLSPVVAAEKEAIRVAGGQNRQPSPVEIARAGKKPLNVKWSQGDSNPCYRRERPAS